MQAGFLRHILRRGGVGQHASGQARRHGAVPFDERAKGRLVAAQGLPDEVRVTEFHVRYIIVAFGEEKVA